ncbi:MAG: GFA family protein [Aquabacterium sp.]|nr:GFA family protein [Aquabacterium sp.]
MPYRASCHCGQVALQAEGQIAQVASCNCSMCRRKGALLWFVPREQVTLLTPEDAAATYTFHKHVIRHRFCPRCGIHPYGEGTDPQGRAMVAINARCIDELDLDAIPVQHFDGRSL